MPKVFSNLFGLFKQTEKIRELASNPTKLPIYMFDRGKHNTKYIKMLCKYIKHENQIILAIGNCVGFSPEKIIVEISDVFKKYGWPKENLNNIRFIFYPVQIKKSIRQYILEDVYFSWLRNGPHKKTYKSCTSMLWFDNNTKIKTLKVLLAKNVLSSRFLVKPKQKGFPNVGMAYLDTYYLIPSSSKESDKPTTYCEIL